MYFQLIYSSESRQPLDEAALEAILTVSRRNNTARDITGAFVYVEGAFLQILEGAEDAVRQLADVIAADPRHHRFRILSCTHTPERIFGEWAMVRLTATAQQFAAWSGQPGTATIQQVLDALGQPTGETAQLMVRILEAVQFVSRITGAG